MLTVDGDEASTVRTIIPIVIQTGGSYYFGGAGPKVHSPSGWCSPDETTQFQGGKKHDEM